MYRLRSLVLCLLVSLFFAIIVGAQTSEPSPTATPISPELQELIDQNAILEQRKKAAEAAKAIAEAEKAELAAKYPKPTTTPLAGTTEVDSGVKIESEMMAYKALADTADLAVKRLKDSKTSVSHLAIFNTPMIRAFQNYNVTDNQIVLLKAEYDRLLANPKPPSDEGLTTQSIFPGSAPIIAQSLLGGFVDLLALLRTDTSVKGLSFTIPESAFVSEIFRAMKDQKNGYGSSVNLFFPTEFPPNPTGIANYKILSNAIELQGMKTRAEKLLTMIDETVKTRDKAKAAIKGLKDRNNQIPADIKDVNEELAILIGIHRDYPTVATRTNLDNKGKQLADLQQEEQKNLREISKKEAEVKALDENLETLLREIRPDISRDQIEALIASISETYATTSQSFLNRRLTFDELREITAKEANSTKAAILSEAIQRRGGRSLTPDEVTRLFEPVNTVDRENLHKVLVAQRDDAVFKLSRDYGRVFSEDEMLAMLYKEPTRTVVKNALEKNKDYLIAQLRAINGQTQKLLDDLIKVDSATGISPIATYIQAEDLKTALPCNDPECTGSYILSLSVVQAGGNNRIKRNLIRDVFAGADITHSGGAIVQFKLYDMKGRVVASDTLTRYEYYRSPRNISKMAQ